MARDLLCQLAMRLAAIIALLIASSLPASAQPGLTPPGLTPPNEPFVAPIEPPPPKNPLIATLWAVGATGLAAATFVVAAENEIETLGWTSLGLLAVAPSTGHIYAGEYGHAVATSAIRLGGMTAFFVGAIKQFAVYYDCEWDCESSDADEGKALMWIGGLTFVGATLYDFYDAHRAARRTNAKARAAGWAVAPRVMPAVGGPAAGVGLSRSW